MQCREPCWAMSGAHLHASTLVGLRRSVGMLWRCQQRHGAVLILHDQQTVAGEMTTRADKLALRAHARAAAAYRNFRDCLPDVNCRPGFSADGSRLMRGVCCAVQPFITDVGHAVTLQIESRNGRTSRVIAGLNDRKSGTDGLLGRRMEIRVDRDSGY